MKRAILKISTELIGEMLKRRSAPAFVQVTSNALPDDAVITDTQADIERPGVLKLAIVSESFPDVQNGQCCPELTKPMMTAFFPPKPRTPRSDLEFDEWWEQHQPIEGTDSKRFAKSAWDAATEKWGEFILR